MKFQEIFNEHGMYITDSFAQGVCFEIRKDGTLLLVTYEHEKDFNPTRENAIMYKELFDKDYKKVFTKKDLFPNNENVCEKCPHNSVYVDQNSPCKFCKEYYKDGNNIKVLETLKKLIN